MTTAFGNEEDVELPGWMKVGENRRFSRDMFIAQVVGKSMEPTIPDGSYSIFRLKRGGSRNGLIVLGSRHVSDPELFQEIYDQTVSKQERNAAGRDMGIRRSSFHKIT